MSRRADSPSLAPGDIVHFIYLHLDTACYVERHPHKEKTHIYRLEAKARPMLVLSEKTRNEQGRSWYRVSKITTKRFDAHDKAKPGYISLGSFIDPGRDSYVYCYPEWYPANLMSLGEGGETKSLNPLELGNILRIMNRLSLRCEDPYSADRG